MGIVDILLPVGVYAGLGLVSSAVTTLLMAFSISSAVFQIIVGVIVIAVGCLFGFFVYLWREDLRQRTMAILTALFCVVGGIVHACCTGLFYLTSGYCNRLAAHLFIFIGAHMAIVHAWPFLSNLLLRSTLDGAGLDKPKEIQIFYVVEILAAIILDLFFCIPQYQTIGEQWRNSIALGVAPWFINAILSGLTGFLITRRSSSNSTAAYDAVPVPDPEQK